MLINEGGYRVFQQGYRIETNNNLMYLLGYMFWIYPRTEFVLDALMKSIKPGSCNVSYLRPYTIWNEIWKWIYTMSRI